MDIGDSAAYANRSASGSPWNTIDLQRPPTDADEDDYWKDPYAPRIFTQRTDPTGVFLHARSVAFGVIGAAVVALLLVLVAALSVGMTRTVRVAAAAAAVPVLSVGVLL